MSTTVTCTKCGAISTGLWCTCGADLRPLHGSAFLESTIDHVAPRVREAPAEPVGLEGRVAPADVSDVEAHRRMILSTRSFTTQAVIALVLYLVFWVPGLIGNLVWYFEAKRIEEQTGQPPAGKGCLFALLWVFVFAPPLIGALLLLILFLGAVFF